MKKLFEFEEVVTHSHSIELEISPELEQEFEDFCNEIATKMDNGDYGWDIERIVSDFNTKFGREAVSFIEDGSPRTDFSAV